MRQSKRVLNNDNVNDNDNDNVRFFVLFYVIPKYVIKKKSDYLLLFVP